MSEKNQKIGKKVFDPFTAVITDSIDTGFFGNGHIDMKKLINNCKKRGLIGIWSQPSLSKPLALFVEASSRMNSDEIDVFLTSFAETIEFDVNLVKQHFYAICQGWEKQFLSDLEKENVKDKAVQKEETTEVEAVQELANLFPEDD